ncbi:hypothetical protein C8J56DRAFT_1172081 [Mycena floridula]|nr:hypothetical protein C8J56DRAFT_1172081 [Mycena floridula]
MACITSLSLALFGLASTATINAVLFQNVSVPATQLGKHVTHTGQVTWFHICLANCGEVNKDSDHTVAISKAFYDDNNSGNCDQCIQVTINDQLVGHPQVVDHSLIIAWPLAW